MEMMIVEDGDDNGEERMVMVTVVVVRVMMIIKTVMANALYTHLVTVHQPFLTRRKLHTGKYISSGLGSAMISILAGGAISI